MLTIRYNDNTSNAIDKSIAQTKTSVGLTDGCKQSSYNTKSVSKLTLTLALALVY